MLTFISKNLTGVFEAHIRELHPMRNQGDCSYNNNFAAYTARECYNVYVHSINLKATLAYDTCELFGRKFA